jgi:outer membrane protein assembly factor BamB
MRHTSEPDSFDSELACTLRLSRGSSSVKGRFLRRQAILVCVVAAIEILSLSPTATASGSGSSTSSTTLPSGYNGTFFHSVNLSSLNESRLAMAGYSAPTPPAWASSSNWYTYQWNGSGRTGYNPNETTLNRSNAHTLTKLWSQYNISGPITASMIAVDGTLYVASWGGKLYALDARNGNILWSDQLTNAVSVSGCATWNHVHGGIYSTPTYYQGMLYETAGTSNLSAIYPSNGTIAWKADVANSSVSNATSPYMDAQLWSSPLIYNGSAYVGLASGCDRHAFQGQLVQVPLSWSTTNHPVKHVFYATPGNTSGTGHNIVNNTGGGIWSTPTVDPANNVIWVTTGNYNNTNVKGYSQSIVGLDASNVSKPPLFSAYFYNSGACGGCSDVDFGAGATLFQKSAGTLMVGAISKDNVFGSLLRSSGAYAWNKTLASEAWGHSIAPAAYDGHTLFVAAGQKPCPTNQYNGTINALNVNNGSDSTLAGGWSACANPQPGLPGKQGAIDIAGLAAANGLVVDASNTLPRTGGIPDITKGFLSATLEVRNASTGGVLYSYPVNRSIAGEPIISDGRIFVGLGNWSSYTNPGIVEAFGIPLSVRPTMSTVPPSTSGGTWVVGGWAAVTGGLPSYTCVWYWGSGSANSTGCGTPSHPQSFGYPILPVISYSGNLTVLDYQGAKVVIPFTVAIGSTTNVGVTSDILVLNCATGTGSPANGESASGSCTGPLSGPLNVSAFSKLFGGIPPYTYSWNFGDGSPLVGTQNANHAYSTAGSYLIRLTGSDSHGIQAIAMVWITV